MLLILAGVTIATLTGENGILTRANDAKEKTEQAEKDEKTNLSRTEDLINQYVDGIEVEQVTDENPGVLETEGTDTYIINSIEDLVVFASNVREGNTYEGQTVKLGLSLDFNSTKSYVDAFRTDYEEYGYDGELKTLLTSGEGFKPIGTTYDADISTNYFGGTFDGEYNIIYNLYQNYEDSENTSIIGFFSTNTGTISNLRIENCNISAITNNMHIVVGIICGRNNGNITNCGSSGNLTITDNGVKAIYCAGITGQAMGSIEKSFSKTNIEVTSNDTSTINVGGITGALTEDYIKSCYNTGTITTELSDIGGICGELNNSKISNCYNMGNITGKATIANFLGGVTSNIVGNCTIINSYSAATVSSINQSLSTYTGAIIGRVDDADISTIIENNYFLENTVNGGNGINVIEGTKSKSSDEMKEIYNILGNKFKEDTNIINNGYPILFWQ